MFGIGMQELLLIFVVAMIVLGPKKLPELAKTLGRAAREFRKASNDLKQAIGLDETESAPEAKPEKKNEDSADIEKSDAENAGAEGTVEHCDSVEEKKDVKDNKGSREYDHAGC